MKDTIDSSAAVARAQEKQAPEAGLPSSASGAPTEHDGFTNRKLIRPSLQSRSERVAPRPPRNAESGERTGGGVAERGERSGAPAKKSAPPEQTHAENFYYQKQIQAKTPMVVLLNDGEEIRGVIEWYDKNCIKINRTGSLPNLLIYKPSIKYLFKESESTR